MVQSVDGWHWRSSDERQPRLLKTSPVTTARRPRRVGPAWRAVVTGVDHVGDKGTRPPEFGVGDDTAIVPPPQIFCHKYKNEHSVAFKIRQNRFGRGRGGPRWGSSRRSPDTLVGWRGDTPPHTLPHSAPIHLGPSPCVPPEFQPDLRLWPLWPSWRVAWRGR